MPTWTTKQATRQARARKHLKSCWRTPKRTSSRRTENAHQLSERLSFVRESGLLSLDQILSDVLDMETCRQSAVLTKISAPEVTLPKAKAMMIKWHDQYAQALILAVSNAKKRLLFDHQLSTHNVSLRLHFLRRNKRRYGFKTRRNTYGHGFRAKKQ